MKPKTIPKTIRKIYNEKGRFLSLTPYQDGRRAAEPIYTKGYPVDINGRTHYI